MSPYSGIGGNSEEESSIEGDYLLNYCQINENQCIYKVLTVYILKKEKNIRLK